LEIQVVTVVHLLLYFVIIIYFVFGLILKSAR